MDYFFQSYFTMNTLDLHNVDTSLSLKHMSQNQTIRSWDIKAPGKCYENYGNTLKVSWSQLRDNAIQLCEGVKYANNNFVNLYVNSS